MPLAAGTRLGPYEVVSPLGAGGMGEVFRARDARLGRDVAIKVLPPELAGDAERAARFRREAQLLAALSHPNVAAVHGFEEADGRALLVMELVEGEDLAQRLARGALPVDEALAIARQVAAALEAAHERGIVHRDLKPANVRVTPDGRVKVLDFGLAKALAPDEASASGENLTNSPTLSRRATEAGLVLGTAAYMSPEQARGRPVDRRSDLWAFGVVLFEMLAGRRLFDGETVSDTLAAVLRQEVPWSALPAATPPSVRRLLARCLERDPKLRLRDAGDAALELEAGPEPAIVPAPRGRARLAWGAAGLALLAALLLAARGGTREARRPLLRAALTLPDAARFEAAVAIPEISPDGRTVVFSPLSGIDRAPLWILSLSSDEARPLPGTEGGIYPFWSPDGRSVAYFADRKLQRLDLAGGSPVTICETADRGARGGSWNAEGTIIFAGGRNSAILRVPATGGTPRSVTALDPRRGDNSHRWPRFLPDGRRFVYWASPNTGDGRQDALFFASLDGKESRIVATGISNAQPAAGRLLFLRARDARLFAQRFEEGKLAGEPVPVAERVASGLGVSRAMFSASETGEIVYLSERTEAPITLEWRDAAGRSAGAVGEPGFWGFARLSPDGARVAASLLAMESRQADVWILDGARRTRLTFGGANVSPVWSPDGRTLAYTRCDERGCEIAARPSSGGPEKKIVSLAETRDLQPTDWSPDGRTLAVDVWNAAAGNYDVWLCPVAGGEPVKFASSPADESGARFSPDGRFLAYTSSESGREEVYVRALEGPGKWQLSAQGGQRPRWRRDGRALFYVSPQRQLLEVAVGREPSEAEAPRSVFERRLSDVSDLLEVAPSGDRFLVGTPPPEAEHPVLRLVSGWTSLLPR